MNGKTALMTTEMSESFEHHGSASVCFAQGEILLVSVSLLPLKVMDL